MSEPGGADPAPEAGTIGAAQRPPFVGLTGGIGAGKSEALRALERLGAATLSTDAVVHELYASEEVRDAVVARWGADVAPDGVVDRGRVASHAFSAPAEREWLEQLLWPRVGDRLWRWKAEQEARVPPPKALVVEVPLLFESGLDRGYDATVAVVADEAVRARRAAARGHRAVDERTARQLPQDEKAARADHVVRNSGSIRDLEAELSALVGRLGSGRP